MTGALSFSLAALREYSDYITTVASFIQHNLMRGRGLIGAASAALFIVTDKAGGNVPNRLQ